MRVRFVTPGDDDVHDVSAIHHRGVLGCAVLGCAVPNCGVHERVAPRLDHDHHQGHNHCRRTSDRHHDLGLHRHDRSTRDDRYHGRSPPRAYPASPH